MFMSAIRIFVLCIIPLLCACPGKTSPHLPIDQTGPVDVEPVEENIGKAGGLTDEAKKRIQQAQEELRRAKKEAEDAKKLVEEMKKNNSPFAERIETLTKVYEERIAAVQKQLDETGVILDEQKQALEKAKEDLNKAKQQSLASENEKKLLRSANKSLVTSFNQEKKRADSMEKYKDKYYKLLKYRWIVWGIGAWLVIKFLGSMGAWSPQGRVARFLVG